MAVTLGLAITLSVTYELTPDMLVVTYTVINGSPGPIYVFDKSYRVTPDGVVPREGALLVSLEAPDTVVLASKLLPIPPGTTFATPPTAWGTLIKAGERLTGKASLPLPLKFDPAAEETKEKVFSLVRFELGYVADCVELAAKPTSLKNVFELAAVAWKKQAIVKTNPAKLNVTGLVKP